MHRKDYQLIAGAVKDSIESPTGRINHAKLVRILCERLAKDNPLFNPIIFTQACGLQSLTKV